jgi:urea transporter
MKQYVNFIFSSYSELLFLKHYAIGLLILVSTLINPSVGLAGIISVVAAHLFARLINMDQDFLKPGFFTYNPLLVGLSIGYIFRWTPLTALFLIIAGIFTLIITIGLANLFSTYLSLPVLSLPFALVSTVVYLALTQVKNLARHSTLVDQPDMLPVWLAGYFKVLGTIFFMPQVIPGIILAFSILAVSRILFLLSVAGYYTGAIFTALLFGSFSKAFTDVNLFNCILIAMAVGGIFLIPSKKSYGLALIAVCISVVLLAAMSVFWSTLGVPVFTLPFNAVLLSMLYALSLIKYPHLAQLVKSTPEETLDLYMLNQRRYQGTFNTLTLPFSGRWTVMQGFEGPWTHQGAWKHAYDFVITDEHGRVHRHAGHHLSDYYAFHKPVLSPVSGQVVRVVNTLPDNPIGQVDKTNNWGNLVIIRDARRFFVEISHFAQNSIVVEEGAWIERGAYLGLCGNSGYSPQPHIHIQVQLTGAVGAQTVPFSFVNYANHTHFYANELPPEGRVVEPLYGQPNLEIQTSFILDDVYQYDVFKNGKKIDELTLKVKMLPDGMFYFDSGRGKLYFGQNESVFYFYSIEGRDPYLKLMLLALPRLPMACRENLLWHDYVPIGQVLSGLSKTIVLFISSFHHDFSKIKAYLKCTHKNKVIGLIQSPLLGVNKKTAVEWGDGRGFTTIKVDDFELQRVMLP